MKMVRTTHGASGDAIILMMVKLITAALGLVITRLLSRYLSVYDYGTYSQILLIVSTVSSITIFGMIDGVNFFYCSEKNPEYRETYIANIFTMQCIVSAVVGAVVLALTSSLCTYFGNPQIRRLIIFAVSLPALQNLVSMLQVLLVSTGRATMLAFRNFLISIIRLVVALTIVAYTGSVFAVLSTTLLLDIGQIIAFYCVLRKSDCKIYFCKLDVEFVKRILHYCAPMAMFVILSTMNRNVDKFLVARWTNTETLAIYSNASKELPFDIVVTSFATVLVPHIAKFLAQNKSENAAKLCKLFFEIAYISTGILCCAALAGAPQLLKTLYSDQYATGLSIFVVYILVDFFKFANVTIILSAAGKTKRLMLCGCATIVGNLILNVLFYRWWGILGPALATLVVTVASGVIMMLSDAGALKTQVRSILDFKFFVVFVLENAVLLVIMSTLRNLLESKHMHYFVILVIVAGTYGLAMLVLNGKRFISNIKKVSLISQGADFKDT